MEFGNEQDIFKEINYTLTLLKKENRFPIKMALYNYIGNLYSALSVVKGYKIEPSKKEIFGNLDQYRKFKKNVSFLQDRFCDNFIFFKDFHSDYLNSILCGTEKVFIDNFCGASYSLLDSYLGEKDFLQVFHDFCAFLGIEELYKDIIFGKRVFSMIKGNSFYDNFLGLTLHSPLSRDSNILIDNFDYNLESLFTLVHETAHYYDLRDFYSEANASEYINYQYKSLYQEVFSRLFERLFLDFLIKNNIKKDNAIDMCIDMYIINHDYLLGGYIFSLLDDYYISHERYKGISNETIYNLVCNYFDECGNLEEYILNSRFDLMDNMIYAYGDILSMFLMDIVLEEGLDNSSIRKFMNIRSLEFSDDYIVSSEFTSDKYIELYSQKVKSLTKEKF